MFSISYIVQGLIINQGANVGQNEKHENHNELPQHESSPWLKAVASDEDVGKRGGEDKQDQQKDPGNSFKRNHFCLLMCW